MSHTKEFFSNFFKALSVITICLMFALSIIGSIGLMVAYFSPVMAVISIIIFMILFASAMFAYLQS